MRQIFGDFVEPNTTSREYLIIYFSPTSLSLPRRWRNRGLSANFLAEYWETFFPVHDVSSQNKHIEILGSINYIANELLENVIKFSHQPAKYPVYLGLYLYQDAFKFYTSNAIVPQTLKEFQAFIQRLLTEDPGEMYMQQLELNVANEDGVGSCLGLLMMLNDYDAHLAWKFEPDSRDSGVIVVTTMVQIDL